jgi:hypothetical protein
MTVAFRSSIPYVATDTSITVFLNGKSLTIASDHPNFKAVRQALKTKQYGNLETLMNARAAVQKFLSPDKDFALINDQVVFQGHAFSDLITGKVLKMIAEGFDATPLFNFLRNCMANPFAEARDELLLFCEANGFMIDEDGYILAYKSVRDNYRDIHSGQFDNSVGRVVKMHRKDVDSRRDVTCSNGLHFAALEYAKNFGSGDKRIMVLRINPADVVSIPNDYANQKGRCCRYEVIAELASASAPLPVKAVYTKADVADVAKDCAVTVDGKVYYSQRDAKGHFISRRKAKGKARVRAKVKGRK